MADRVGDTVQKNPSCAAMAQSHHFFEPPGSIMR